MKKIAGILGIAGMIVLAGMTWAETVSIAITPICPHMCDPATESGYAGFAVEITQEVFKAAGHDIKVSVVPWARAMKMFQEHEVDSAHLIKSHALDMNNVIFTEIPVTKFNNKFYAAKGNSWSANWTYNGVPSLEQLKFGAIKGWTYMNQELDAYLAQTPELQVQFAAGEDAIETNIKKLMRNRIDLMILNPSILIHTLSKLQNKGTQVTMDDLVDLGWVPTDVDVGSYVAFHNTERGKRLAQDFNRAMLEFKNSGKLSEIWKQWDIKE